MQRRRDMRKLDFLASCRPLTHAIPRLGHRGAGGACQIYVCMYPSGFSLEIEIRNVSERLVEGCGCNDTFLALQLGKDKTDSLIPYPQVWAQQKYEHVKDLRCHKAERQEDFSIWL